MRSATFQSQLSGTVPHDWAEVAETLARVSCGNLAGADVVRDDGDVEPASEIGRWDLLRGLRGGGGTFGIASRFGFTPLRCWPSWVGSPTRSSGQPGERVGQVLDRELGRRRQCPAGA